VSLEQQSAAELLQWLLGPHPDLFPLRRLLIQSTEGNPFFIEESIRSLAEAGILQGERGAYRPAGSMTAVHVPATVYTVLAARIDRLSPGQKHLLQTASVIGRDVPLSLLRKVAEAPKGALLSDLAHLVASDFIYERTLFPEPEYTFKHALTHEVTYQGLLRSRQRTLHAQVLEALETVNADPVSEEVDRLAYHAFFGEVWDKALAYARQAGARAVARSAHLEAIEWFARALRALAHLPGNTEQTEQAIDLHLL
jgi:predicted ATPase